MKKTIIFAIMFTSFTPFIYCQINNPFSRFWSGLFAQVYSTGTDLELTKVNPDSKSEIEKYKFAKGTFYSIVDEDDKVFYIKITSRLKPIFPLNPDGVKYEALLSRKKYYENNTSPCPKYKDYKRDFKKYDDLFSITNPKRYNKIFEQGVTVGSLFLPIKLRPGFTIIPEGTTSPIEYKREFSTDIAVGPFMGYKYHVGELYDQFIKFGIFAGPSLIKLTSKNLQNGQEGDTNVLGFSWGGGLAGEFKAFQAGIIVGWDYLSGESARNWIYDKKVWISIGIGFNFFQDNANSAK